MLKLGFLGGGKDSIAGKIHILASLMSREFEIVGGIFNSDIKKSKESAQYYKVNHFNSFEEFRNVDIVVILTPTPNHFKDIKEVLKYNKNIIIDKPIVATTYEAKKIKNLDYNFLSVTHNYSGYALIRELREMIKNNILGEIKKIVINMSQESFFKPLKPGYPQQWRLNDLEIPNILLDLGTHTFHLAKFLLNTTFKPIFYIQNSFSNLNVIDDVIIIAKAKQTLIELKVSKISLGNTNPLFIEVYGDKAGAKWSQDDFENLYITYKNGKKEIINRSNAKFEANKDRYNTIPPGHPNGFLDAFMQVYIDIANKVNKKECFYDYNENESIESIKFLKEAIDVGKN